MKSDLLGGHPRLRRVLPWALWGLTAAIAVPMALSQAGIASSPAMIEARIAAVAPIRTAHRLRVARILVQPGQRVQAGELLVEMDTAEIEAELAVARAKLAYVELLAGWRQLRLQSDQARTAHVLASTAERSAVDLARVLTAAERDRSELAQLDANLDVEQQLVGDQLASAERLKAMKLQRAALAKRVEEYGAVVARARRSASASTGRLSEWRQNGPGETGERARPTADEDVRAAAAEVQRREIAQLELVRSQHALRAPFAGRVGEVLARVGELSADPATPLVTVVEDPATIAIAYLAQGKANQVHEGDRAKLVPRDLSGPPLTGQVTALAPNVTEIPERFRHVPRLREYGRNVYIRLDAPAVLPGQAFDAVFRRASGGGT